MSSLELYLLVLQTFGMKENWPDWKQVLSQFLMPSLQNPHADTRHMAAEVIGHMYTLVGDDLQSEVLLIAQ